MKNIFITMLVLINASYAFETEKFTSNSFESYESVVADFDMELSSDLEGLKPDLTGSEEIYNSAYNSRDLIDFTLENRLDYSMGDRVRFLDQKAGEIVTRSAKKENELYMRKTLNRTRQMARLTVEFLGETQENNVRWLANFYKSGFDLAKSVIVTDTTIDEYYRNGKNTVTSFKYGQMHALRMWKNSTGLRNKTVKGLFLVKLIDYILDDLSADLENREYESANLFKDALDITKKKSYRKVTRALEIDEVPSSSDLAGLRKEIYRLIRRVNSKS